MQAIRSIEIKMGRKKHRMDITVDPSKPENEGLQNRSVLKAHLCIWIRDLDPDKQGLLNAEWSLTVLWYLE